MKQKPGLLQIGQKLLLCSGLFLVALSGALGQAPGARFNAGEIILFCQPNTPLADVNALVARVNARTVVPLLLRDCYKVILPDNRMTAIETTNAVAQLKMQAKVRWVGPNYHGIKDQTVEPKDPRYVSREQWPLALINMPRAWSFQKGATNVTVAVIDSGFRPTHEDVLGRFSSGSYDVADNDADVTTDGTDAAADHGTWVSGLIMANTDNNKGIAGICWENVKVLALKIQKRGTGNLDGAAIINAYAYLAANAERYNIKVVNMSYGGQGDPNDVNDPQYVGLKALFDKGIILVGSTGNQGASNLTRPPSALSFVNAVSASNRVGRLTSYSNTGKVEFLAPGGDAGDPTDGYLTTGPNNGYDFVTGTSFACPTVSGIFGLMMSTPGLTSQQAIQVLKDTATRTGITTVPDPRVGFGLINAGEAIARVSVRVSILDPVGVDGVGNSSDPNNTQPPVETFKPTIRFRVNNIPLANLTVRIDGQTVPTNDLTVESGNATSVNPQYVVAFRKQFPTTQPYQHTIVVTGTNLTTNITSSDTRIITLQPRIVTGYPVVSRAGVRKNIAFLSIPYYEGAADSPTRTFRDATQLLGPNVTLFRYIYDLTQTNQGVVSLAGKYAKFPATTPTDQPDRAKLLLPTAERAVAADGTDVGNVGAAWFADIPGDVLIPTNGVSFTSQSIRIPLHEGWNAVGCAYPYPVSFNTVLVETSNGTRITAQQAADQKLILPFIYRFIGGEYQFQTLPNGSFVPWEGHWVYVVPRGTSVATGNPLTLIMSPTPTNLATRAVAAVPTAQPTVSGAGSWLLRLEARVNNLTDTYNFVGMSASATEGEDRTKVPKPPKPAPYVSLGSVRPNTGAFYAQDLRPIGGVKSWDMVVATDQPNANVVLSWPAVKTIPKNYRLTLTDKTTGQTVDLRSQSSFQFNTGRSAPIRTFTLTARPSSLGGRAILSNVFVNPAGTAAGRSNPTYEIGYTVSQDVRVEASVLTFGGRALAQVGPTRSVTSGDNRLVWNGRDSAGRVLPAGTYVLQLKAVTADGEVTREIRPLLITGR